VIIRDSREDAVRFHREMFARHGNADVWKDQPVGTPEDVAEKLAPLVELGYRHLIAGFPAPHDEESQTRFATEVRPMLERVGG
jgi:alkanesulfonate monooxygenase SsuD/methylene tetrahydromethanopterin reductase-like flavin-dependent oxidoreductase (luciferase family)